MAEIWVCNIHRIHKIQNTQCILLWGALTINRGLGLIQILIPTMKIEACSFTSGDNAQTGLKVIAVQPKYEMNHHSVTERGLFWMLYLQIVPKVQQAGFEKNKKKTYMEQKKASLGTMK